MGESKELGADRRKPIIDLHKSEISLRAIYKLQIRRTSDQTIVWQYKSLGGAAT